ncbi:YggS family pyridoxal phosphate-dependent enzyme [Neptuniibacter sp. CAU 1671]|uniref:YggS family pyridoxal phosphate-dependent enzyme n=1 Tax=Neptuniibacter sp. CAU 1671 TaxID=3032593 RepID=UPI0023DBFE99|nr:YggS family pyridoxal phosphate-dependent enzyme [Neptuniibacter sp. CAU 1671]MDF2182387.1 YggS family pyridoxal phosphate-dependent enzyme [Neptuniibacter sp. CAU 1671]
MQNIADNLGKIHLQIRAAEANAHRAAGSVTLLAVSKTQPASALREAYAAGQTAFGENYLQEALEKIESLSDLKILWHFIGPLQSNKTRKVAENFAWVHSVDRLKLAERLSEQRPGHLPPLQICLQVNISQEQSKSGCAPESVIELARAIQPLPNITLRGLMAIPQATNNPQEQQQAFHALAELLKSLQNEFPEMDTLSMGMSGDMEMAIAEGATIVRIGTAIFGARQPR